MSQRRGKSKILLIPYYDATSRLIPKHCTTIGYKTTYYDAANQHHTTKLPTSQAKFDLPVFVYAGLIGSLELQVPWKALWTSPTRVAVENVVLLVVPKEAAPYR